MGIVYGRHKGGERQMCHAYVTRTPKSGDGNLEYIKKDGGWTKDAKKSYQVSEDDAKVFARVLTKSTGKTDEYHYDYTTVDTDD